MSLYYRPIPRVDPCKTSESFAIAAGGIWFDQVEVLERGREPYVVPANAIPEERIHEIKNSRGKLMGISTDKPILMGILNTTPDSFSDGGAFATTDAAIKKIKNMEAQGAQIIDVGGESTKPGAVAVSQELECKRIRPIFEQIEREKSNVSFSIDTRKSGVADIAIRLGAGMVNDVSAMTYDDEMSSVITKHKAHICLMHSNGDPETMQIAPYYDNVLLDVYDSLSLRIVEAEKMGIPKSRIIIDPGIGFGKNIEHNLALLKRLSLFHGLGCKVLLGASRKKFIGVIGQEQIPSKRALGSVAVGLEALRQGVQVLRVHDIAEHYQAVALWNAMLFPKTA
ncbi:MAG: dihydropteroate synthase [Proteobacteria bacterium]|jgi:dihydropteroate synthase|nr:dihydropteroate synthase [Pseudomonadota bacterium]